MASNAPQRHPCIRLTITNVKRLSEPKMVMGLTEPQAIEFIGDLCLNMLNTTGRSSQIVVKDV